MALRDTVIGVLFDLKGDEDIRRADAEIEKTASSAEEMETNAEQAGESMEEAGEKGEESFDQASDSVEGLSENLTTITATSGTAFATLSAGLGFGVQQAGELESAMTRVEATGGEMGDTLVRTANQVSRSTGRVISQQEVLRGQMTLLEKQIPTDTVNEATGAITTLAQTMERDVTEVFDQISDPLNEATGGFDEIINSGPIAKETFLENARAMGLQVNKLTDINEEMDKSTVRQALLNTIIQEANNRRGAASEIQGSWNSQTSRFNNLISRASAIMVGPFFKALSGTLTQLNDWLQNMTESDKATLRFIGRLALFGTVVSGLVTVVGALALAVSFFGGAAVLTTAGVSALAVVAGILLVPIIDLIFLLTTGESLLINWSNLFNAWEESTLSLLGSQNLLLRTVGAVSALFLVAFKSISFIVGVVIDQVIRWIQFGIDSFFRFQRAVSIVTRNIIDVWNFFGNLLTGNFSKALGNLENIWSRTSSFLLSAVPKMVGQIIDIFTFGFGTKLVSFFKSAGSNLISSFIGSLTGSLPQLKKTVSSVVSTVRDYLPFSPAKIGPLSDLDKTGRKFNQTIAEGMKESDDSVAKQTVKTLEKTKSTVTEERQTKEFTRTTELDTGGTDDDPSPIGGATRTIRLEIADESDTDRGSENVRRLAERLRPILSEELGIEVVGAGA